LYEFEAPQRAEPLYRRVSRLQALFEYIVGSEDSRFLSDAGQEQDKLVGTRLVPSVRSPLDGGGYSQRSEMKQLDA